MENCGSFKNFSFIFIYRYIDYVTFGYSISKQCLRLAYTVHGPHGYSSQKSRPNTEKCVYLSVGPIHYSRDSQKISLKMGPMVLFTHLKIILLQCFQFFNFQQLMISKQTLTSYTYFYHSTIFGNYNIVPAM